MTRWVHACISSVLPQRRALENGISIFIDFEVVSCYFPISFWSFMSWGTWPRAITAVIMRKSFWDTEAFESRWALRCLGAFIGSFSYMFGRLMLAITVNAQSRLPMKLRGYDTLIEKHSEWNETLKRHFITCELFMFLI